jgi:acetyl-CoA synthase
MSKFVAASAMRGAHDVLSRTRARFDSALAERGAKTPVGFPETAFFLPMAYALLGAEVETLGEMGEVLEYTEELLPQLPTEESWLPYLAGTIDAGIATLLGEEILKCLDHLEGQGTLPGWHGFISDTILRSLGIQLVDGRMPGFAAIVGAAPSVEIAEQILRGYQQRNILSFLVGNSEGVTMRDQLVEAGILKQDILDDPHKGWDIYCVPLGPDTESLIYALHWAIRGAVTFGGLKKGDWKGCLAYCREHIYAFGLGLGPLDDVKYANGAGAIAMGFPIVADTLIPEIRPTGVTTYEALVRELDHDKLVQTCIDVRGVKVTIREVNVPVPVAAAFEGETVRREDMYVEFGSKYSTALEYVQMADMDEVEDGKIVVVGPDIDTVAEGSALPLGLYVQVAGRKMQKDFESILERQVHSAVNHAMGLFHMGQRDMPWVRVSKDAYKAGWRLKHFGEVIIAHLKNEFGAIVDKAQVTVMTDQAAVDNLLTMARPAYRERDERVAGLTDDGVDLFYSCTLCQSYAPTHVCVISPERLGLCGAYNWLDGRASFEMNPHGPNQPIAKGRLLDKDKGEWEDINKFVIGKSNRSIERVCLYSIMDAPMTSCGCFECILAILPEVNGFMLVNREYAGMTPIGMPFSTLAGSVGGGHQTPGFLGVGRRYAISRKFIAAEGGLPRLVWMTKELKRDLAEGLQQRAEELGMPDLVEKIATEDDATTVEELMAYLEKVGHPAMAMEMLF